MTYKHKLLHIFLGLFVFYALFLFVSVSIYILATKPELYIPVITNKYVWMLYAPFPLSVGMLGALVFAFVIQWGYQCRVEKGELTARDGIGKSHMVGVGEVTEITTYNFPLIPIARLAIPGKKRPLWVCQSALPAVG